MGPTVNIQAASDTILELAASMEQAAQNNRWSECASHVPLILEQLDRVLLNLEGIDQATASAAREKVIEFVAKAKAALDADGRVDGDEGTVATKPTI